MDVSACHKPFGFLVIIPINSQIASSVADPGFSVEGWTPTPLGALISNAATFQWKFMHAKTKERIGSRCWGWGAPSWIRH